MYEEGKRKTDWFCSMHIANVAVPAKMSFQLTVWPPTRCRANSLLLIADEIAKCTGLSKGHVKTSLWSWCITTSTWPLQNLKLKYSGM